MKRESAKSAYILSLILLIFVVTISSAAKSDIKRNMEKPGKKISGSENSAEKRKSKIKKTTFKLETVGKSEKTLSSAAIKNRFFLNKPVAEFTESGRRKIRGELEILRRRKTTQQFLSIIRIAEAGEPNIMVGDKPGCRVGNLKKHPGEVLPKRCFYYFYDKKGKLQFSTASGNYQITRQNFRVLAPFLDLRDFEVDSQQLAALELVRRGGRKPKQVIKGFEALVRGDVKKAVELGAVDWASIPGSDLPGKKRKDFKQIVQNVLRNSNGKSRKTKNNESAPNLRAARKNNK
jgi:muramidase (phage lysozyme)